MLLMVVLFITATVGLLGALFYVEVLPMIRRANQNRQLPRIARCIVNGAVGIVPLDAYIAEERRMRKAIRRMNQRWLKESGLRFRPQVYPVFLFSDKTPKGVGEPDFRTGTLEDANRLMEGCIVEEKTFEVPPVFGRGSIPVGYTMGTWEQVGREGSRQIFLGFAAVYRLIHGRDLQ